MTLPIGALAPHVVMAALGSSGTLLVAAAGVVVVLAILLVFVMVLRSNGAAKRTANGLGYDPQQGPLGQPSAGRGGSARPSQAGRAPQRADADYGGGYDDGYDDGYDNNYGGRPAARGAASQGAPQEAWGAQATPSQARWNDPAAQQRMAAPAGQTPQWGAPDGGMAGPMGAGQGQPGGAAWGAQDDNPWGAGADAWGGRPAAPSRPGGNPFTASNGGNMGQMGGPSGQANPWDAPAPQGQGRNPWGAQGNGWDQPDGMSAQAQPGRQDWGAPVAPASQPPARNGRDPYGAAPDQWGEPMAPAGPQGWNQPAPPASPSQPGYGPRPGANGIGYGEADKTRIAPRQPTAQTRIGALIERQGKDPGHVFELRNERTTIGRSRDSDIFLEDLAVSRLHATINRDPAGRYIFRDENSANGVFVNSEKVTERSLEEGDEVQIGQTMLVFQRK